MRMFGAVRQGLFIALVLVLVSIVGATDAAAQSFRFSQIEVDGNRRIESATILTFSGIESGTTLSAGDLNDAVQRIRSSGLFESVDVVPKGSRLTIVVVEFPTVNVVAFEGNNRLSNDQLSQIVQSQSRRVYSPSIAEQDAITITEAYTNQGRLAAAVTPRIIRRSDNRVDLVFEVVEGGIVEIERLSFVGNRAFLDRRLRRVLQTKQAGLLRVLVQRDTFSEDRIEFDKQVLRDFYLSRGYVDFRTQSVNAELGRERDGFFLTFNVIEGQKFTFGDVTISSDLPEIDFDVYQNALNLRSGATYSPTLIEDDIARLERLALRNGLNFVRVSPRITRDDRSLTLSIDFELTRGPRVFVERIDIEGNTTTLDRVVRRQFKIVEGDPFNPREIRQSAERIRALGYFSSADVNTREGSSPSQVIVDVDVQEQNTGSLSFGGNLSTSNGFGLVASFSERNFLGRGQTFSFSLSTAESSRNLSADFFEPGLFDRDLGLGFSFDYNTTNSDNALYDTETLRLAPSLSFPISENGRLSLRAFVEGTDLTGVGTTTGIIIDEASRGRIWANGLGYSYSFDNRRTGLNPNAGLVFRFSQDFAGLGGDSRYIQTTAVLAAETKILSEEVTLRATIEGGALNFLNGDSRVTDRFFLSSRRMRGFDAGGIGPREINATDNDALGGNYYAVARFEAEFPLGLPEEYGISGGLFLDIGSLWGLDSTSAANGTILYDDFTSRSVIGFSVFWETPIGPLRFNFTEALNAQEFDETQSFDLTISTSF